MRKILLPVTLMLFIAFSTSLVADPVKTTENWIASIFVDGDLKHAFNLLATEDQEFIQANIPELYGFIMGQIDEEFGEIGIIASALQQLVLTTIGKIVKVEITDSEKIDGGYEVYYSTIIPLDIDFFLKLKTWGEEKEREFASSEEPANPMEKIKIVIEEFSAMLDNLNYKTSIALNDFVTIIKEGGEERILLDLKGFQAKFAMLDSL
jgi:hypothetical protein